MKISFFSKVVKYLIKKGAKVNSKDMCDWTPLHLASKNGHLNIVKYLLNTGAHLNSQTLDCETPMAIASIYSRYEVFQYLAQKTTEENNAAAKRKQSVTSTGSNDRSAMCRIS